MYTKTQISKTKQDFWTAFGQYMRPVPSAEGLRLQWQNYKTGIKGIYFRMRAERDYVSIGIEIVNPDLEVQELFFDQFVQFKKLLLAELGEDWEWEMLVPNESGQIISRIEKRVEELNVMDTNDWPDIISFLKPRIMALDSFWSNIKYGFEGLV